MSKTWTGRDVLHDPGTGEELAPFSPEPISGVHTAKSICRGLGRRGGWIEEAPFVHFADWDRATERIRLLERALGMS